MAEISFKGFVEPRQGRGPLTIVEQHRRKDDTTGQWTTESRTYHRVWPAQNSVEPPEGALVSVVGKQKTTKYVKDGETKYSLIVNADSIEVVSGGPVSLPAPAQDVWSNPTIDDSEVPF
jgi:hypothetical protein